MKQIKLFLLLLLFMGAISAISAQVNLTAATGGTGISIDKTTNGGSSTYTTLTNPIIAETVAGSISGTVTLDAPAGWSFETTALSVAINITGAGADIDLGSGSGVSITVTPSATQISFTVANVSTLASTLTFVGIKVVPTGIAPSTGNILMTGGTITGLNGASNFGTLTSVAGAAHHYVVTSNSTSTIMGSTVTITAQLKDQFNNNISTSGTVVTWSDAAAGGSFASATSTTNGSGIATVAYTTKQLVVSTPTVTATTGGVTGNSPLITTVTMTPLNYALGVSITPTFTWGEPGNRNILISTSKTSWIAPALVYNGSSKHGGSGNLTGDTLTVAERLSNGKTYYLSIDGGTTYIDFKTVNESVPMLSPVIPSVTTAYIGWSPVPYSSGLKYDITLSDAADMSNVLETHTVIVPNYTFTGLTNGATYYVRVRSTNSSRTVVVSYSTISHFTTLGPPLPIISYPNDGVTVYASKPTFFWYIEGNEPGVDYEVHYSTTSGVYGATQITTTNHKLSVTATENFTAGQTYYWQVQSKAGLATSGWSAEESFVIYSSVATTPPIPIPSWPDGSPIPTIYNNPPVMYYYIDVYATGLEFQVEYVHGNSALIGAQGTGFAPGNSPVQLDWGTDLFSAASVSLIPGDTYYWHVRSRLAAPPGTVSDWSATATFKVAVTASGAATTPIPSNPVGGQILDSPLSDVTLYWTAPSTESLDYEVRIAQTNSIDGNGALNHPLAQSSGYAVTDPTRSILVTDIGTYTLIPGATYYWQVRSRLTLNNDVFSSWSMIASFSTAAGASSVVPLVVSPNYGQPINNTSAILTWDIPVPTETHLKYDLQYSKNANFTNAVTKSNLTNAAMQVVGLDANSTYYWRVLSKNDLGSISSYSATGSFKTSGATAVEDKEIVPTQFELSQNYPNPFNPTTKITYALPQNSFVNIKVYDMLGREVKSLVNNDMLAGNHSVEWNGLDNSGNKVASGAYIYRITAGNFVSTKKMVLLK